MNIKTQKLFLFALVLVLATTSACTFDEPILPTWFTDWRLPVPNPGFVMSEIVNDTTIVDTTYQGQSTIAISIVDSSERKQISREDLAFLPEGDNAEQSIGDVSLNSPGTEQSNPLPVSDFLGIPLVPGQTINIPASSVPPIPVYLTFGTFEFIVDVKEGTIEIEFVNESFLDFGTATKISIYDSISGDFLGDALFSNPILANTSQLSNPVDLNGNQFSNHLQFILELEILEKTGYTVQPEDPDAAIYFNATISDLEVGYANAEIPEQNFSRKDSVSTANQKDRMKTANIGFGSFMLDIENTLNVSANVTVELLNFYTDPEYNNVLSLEYTLQAQQRDTFSVILNNLYVTDYHNMPTPGSYIDHMKYQFFVQTIPSEEMVELAETDVVILSINPTDSVYLKSFTGDLARREILIDPIENNDIIDSEGFEGSIRFEKVSMTLNIYNQLGIEILVDLNITGYKNEKSESKQLIFDQNPIRVAAREPGEDVHIETIILNNNNSNLVDFVEFLPQDIVTTGTTIIEGEGRVSREKEVWSDYHLFSPLYVKIKENAQYTSKIQATEIDQSTQDAILRGDIDNFYIDLGLNNGLPIGADLKIYLSASRDSIFDETIMDLSRHIIIDDIRFFAGELGPDSFVVAPYEEDVQVYLNNDSLGIFINDTLFVASKLFLDATEGLVKFRSTDEIRANGYLKLRYRINNED
jgi:hypothetical protein